MSQELRNCPLCGSELVQAIGGGPYRVVCQRCGSNTGPRYAVSSADAIAAWNTRDSDSRIAELEAEVDRLRARLNVKPLQWIIPPAALTVQIAETVLGKYRVWTHTEAGGRWFWDMSALGVVAATIETGYAHSLEAAKAAAQADYEARILSALVQP